MSPRTVSVRDVMSHPVVSLEAVLSLPLADWIMRERRIRHLPVVNADRQLVGLVTHRTMITAHHGDPDDVVYPVADIMRTNPVTVSADDTAADTARFMVENKIGCAVVVDADERIEGIVTEADFTELAARLLADAPRIAVDDFMTTDVVMLTEDEPLGLADELMKHGRFRHLPVVDDRGHLVSMVTHRDLLAARLDPDAPDHIRDLKPRDVWSVASGTSARIAARTLADHQFGCLPVTSDGVVVGLITEADVLDLLVRLLTRAGAFRHPDLPLRFYMSAPAQCVGLDTSLEDARDKLSQLEISSLAVVSDSNHMVGIITAADLLAPEPTDCTGVVSELMTRDVLTVDIETTMVEAAREMTRRKIHRVLVRAGNRLAGVVSTSDIVLAVRDMRIHTPLSEIMSPIVLTIGTDETVEAGRSFLESAEVRALIVAERGWPVGVLGQKALLRRWAATAVVEDIMSVAVLALPESMPAFRAAAQMAALGVEHVVAIREGKGVGVVTGMDLTRLCARANDPEGRQD